MPACDCCGRQPEHSLTCEYCRQRILCGRCNTIMWCTCGRRDDHATCPNSTVVTFTFTVPEEKDVSMNPTDIDVPEPMSALEKQASREAREIADRLEAAERTIAEMRDQYLKLLEEARPRESMNSMTSETERLRAAHPIVVAAAVRTADGLIHSMPPPARHHDIVHKLHALGHPQRQEDEQGFVLSDGSFCQRKPAKIIARKAGQLLERARDLDDLYSEDVW